MQSPKRDFLLRRKRLLVLVSAVLLLVTLGGALALVLVPEPNEQLALVPDTAGLVLQEFPERLTPEERELRSAMHALLPHGGDLTTLKHNFVYALVPGMEDPGMVSLLVTTKEDTIPHSYRAAGEIGGYWVASPDTKLVAAIVNQKGISLGKWGKRLNTWMVRASLGHSALSGYLTENVLGDLAGMFDVSEGLYISLNSPRSGPEFVVQKQPRLIELPLGGNATSFRHPLMLSPDRFSLVTRQGATLDFIIPLLFEQAPHAFSVSDFLSSLKAHFSEETVATLEELAASPSEFGLRVAPDGNPQLLLLWESNNDSINLRTVREQAETVVALLTAVRSPATEQRELSDGAVIDVLVPVVKTESLESIPDLPDGWIGKRMGDRDTGPWFAYDATRVVLSTVSHPHEELAALDQNDIPEGCTSSVRERVFVVNPESLFQNSTLSNMISDRSFLIEPRKRSGAIVRFLCAFLNGEQFLS